MSVCSRLGALHFFFVCMFNMVFTALTGMVSLCLANGRKLELPWLSESMSWLYHLCAGRGSNPQWSHRLPGDNQRDREQQSLLKSKAVMGSIYLSGKNLTRIMLIRVKLLPTCIYCLFPLVYFNCVCWCQSRWLPRNILCGWRMDEWRHLRYYVLFNIIAVVSGRWDVDNERLCAMEHRLRLRRGRTRDR